MPEPCALPFRRVFLTGGNGFVGHHLAPMLTAAAPGAERLMLLRPGSSPVDGWAGIEAEIDDRAAIDGILREFRPDLVLHLAAQASVGDGEGRAEETWRVNFGGSLALASACGRFAPAATVLFVSSGEVYGKSLNQGPGTEDTPLRPQSVYARSKTAAEMVLGDVLPNETRLVIVRSFNHIGPGQDERFVVPSFAAQIARIEAGLQVPVLRVGNIEVTRDFVDVRDVCEAYLAVLAVAPNLPRRCVFNVASGRGRTISDLLDLLQAKATRGFDILQDPGRMRPADVPVAVGSNDALSRATGWAPRRSIDVTLLDILDEARRSAITSAR